MFDPNQLTVRNVKYNVQQLVNVCRRFSLS